MMRGLTAILVLVLVALGALAQDRGRHMTEKYCDSSAPINTAASGSTEIVPAAASGAYIYICGYNFMAGGTTNVKLVYGTGVNCATGAVDLTGPYPLIAQTGVSYASSSATIFPLSATAVCINNSAAIQVSGVLTYGKY